MVFGITMYLYELRAFSVSFASILYFTYSKSYFFSLATHFCKTLHISFSILQYIILKYYKIILFLYFFFTLQPNPQQPSKPQEPINHNLNNLINSPDQQPSTSQINNPDQQSTGATATNSHHHRARPKSISHCRIDFAEKEKRKKNQIKPKPKQLSKKLN